MSDDREPTAAQVLQAQRIEAARKDFATHEHKVVGPGHWRLSKPGSSSYWCDIVVMGDCALSVWGDIAGCFFSYYPDAKSPEEVVAWMARADVGYYGHQKAAIGMGNIGVDEYRDEIAIADLRERHLQAPEEFGEAGWAVHGDHYTALFERAIGRFRNGEDRRLILDELYLGHRGGQQHVIDGVANWTWIPGLEEIDQDATEWLYTVGEVTSTRVIYALAAISRLHELLQAAA
jgi:hypothetical protein